MGIMYTIKNSVDRKNGVVAILDTVTGCPLCNRLTNLLYKPLSNSKRLYKACSIKCANILSGKE